MNPVIRRQASLRPHLMGRTALSGLPLLGVSIAALAGISLAASPARALPQDGIVVAGTASIAQTGAASMAIHQATMAAVIDWQSFDIAANETVEVFQPSSMASLLNRVVGGNGSSTILGTLQAQGRLTLVNPAGITIGHSARIDVAGLVASTADMTNHDFMLGRGEFGMAGHSNARITNAGEISIREGGLAAFVAPGVENSGTITARLGRVQLAAGDTFTLDMYGDDLIHVGVSDSTLASIVNTGRISTDGGVIEITARSGAAAVNSLINMGGVVEARSVGMENGAVVFYGASDGVVNVSGTVDVSGRQAGETGGTIKVLGDKVALTGKAALDASGDAGGGTILVGGDYQGQGDTPTASRTFVARDVTIAADAINSGDAQKVVVWADGDTRYFGSISAKGGAQSGNGGMVEVSGKQNLGFDGKVDTSAANGTGGSLLLDPDFIVITNGGPVTGDGEITGDGTILFADGGTATFNISESALEGLAAGTSITLQATNKITIEELTTDGVLTLDQTGFVKFEAGVGGIGFKGINDEIKLTGGGSLTLDATAGPTGDGIVDVGKITLNGGTLRLNGSKVITNISAPVTTSGGAILIIAQDVGFFGAVDAGTGSVNIANTLGFVQLGTFDAAATMNIENTELANITAHLLQINSIDDNIVIQDVAGASTANVDNVYLLGGSVLVTGGTSTFKSLQVDAQNNISLAADLAITTGSGRFYADTDFNGGDFDITSGKTLSFNGTGVFVIQGNDIILPTGGAGGISSAPTSTVLQVYNRSGSISLGGASGFLSSAELNAITASGLHVISTGGITVSDVAQTDSEGFEYIYLADTGTITFSGASTFKSVWAEAGGSIDILADLTATATNVPIGSGNASLQLFADTDGSGGGNLLIDTGVTVQYSGTSGRGAGYINTQAADYVLDGTLSSPDSIDITTSTGSTFAIGATPAGTLNLDNAEFGRLTTPALRLASFGGITINGLSDSYEPRNFTFVSTYGGGNIVFSGAPSSFDGFMEANPTSGFINISQDITADTLSFLGSVQLTGNTVLTATAGGVTTASIDGTFDLTVDANTTLTLGPLGAVTALKNVILDSATDVEIGSAGTPLLVKALTLELFTSKATLNSAGQINGAAINKSNVKFNGFTEVDPPALTITSPPPPPTAPAGTITIISGAKGSGANDTAVADGKILFGDFDVTGFIISEGALEELTGGLTLEAPTQITIDDLTDNQLKLNNLSGPANFAIGASGTGFAMNAGDTIFLDTHFNIDAANGTISLGGITTTADLTLAASDVNINDAINAAGRTVDIINATGNLQLGPDGVTADMDISNAELTKITADSFRISSAGRIIANGVNANFNHVYFFDDAQFTGAASTFSGLLDINSDGGTSYLGANVTVGSFSISDYLLIDGERAIFSSNGGAFYNFVDGDGAGNSLTVTASAGQVKFEDPVGDEVALESLTVFAPDIYLNGVRTKGDQFYDTTPALSTTFLNGDYTSSTGNITILGNTKLVGITGIAATAGSVSMGPVNGNWDLEITAETGLTLGRMGDTESLQNVYLDAPGLNIGSAGTPLFFNGGELEIYAATATLDGAGSINDAPISKANVLFNGALSSTDPDFVITGGSPPPPPFSGLLVNGDIDDFYFSTTASGLVTIRAIETVDDSSDFDSVISLFFDDGTLDVADFIEYDDDDGGGPSDLESLITRSLNAGNYLLRIATHGSSPTEIRATGDGHHDGTDYTLSVVGDFVVGGSGPTSPPPPPTEPPPAPPPPPPPVVLPPPPPPPVEPPPVVETPPILEEPPLVEETPPDADPDTDQLVMDEVMDDSVDVANQVDALTEEGEENTTDEEIEDEALIEAVDDAGLNTPYLQVIEAEDLGEAMDVDDAPAITPDCACSS